jgi:hypothetical protein
MDSRSPALPPAAYAPASWGDANTRGLAFAAIADWRQAAAAFAEAASVLSHDVLHGAPTDALALVLSNLAHACARDGRPEEAIDHAHRALAVREALAGASSPLAARTRMDLAVLLASAGALGEARTLLDTARTQLESTFGTGDVRLLGVLENSARLSLMTGELERAATEVRRLRGVMELHEMPMDRLTALTDRLRDAGVPVGDSRPAGSPDAMPTGWVAEAPEGTTPVDGPTLDDAILDETETVPWLPAEAAEVELPAPWMPDPSPELLWDAGDEATRELPLRELPPLEGGAHGDLLPAAAPAPVFGGYDDPALPPVDASDPGAGHFGLASLLDDAEGGWPSAGAEPADPDAPPGGAPTSAPAASLVEDRWGAMAATDSAADPADSLWSTLLEEDTHAGAASPAETALGWELPQAPREVAVETGAETGWLPASIEATHAAPAPFPQDDDIPWLEAGESSPANDDLGEAFGRDVGGSAVGRLLDEPEPEIPEFLRAHSGQPGSGQAAVATPPSMPVTHADDADGWEEEGFSDGASRGVPREGRPQAGLLPLVPEAARWGETGAATPHEGTVAVYPSPVSKYDEILQRVRKQALANRATHPTSTSTSGRVLVLSVVTVAAVGVGGGLWYTLLR